MSLGSGLINAGSGWVVTRVAGWSARRTADLNGDGKADIVFQNTNGSTAVWLMNGTTMTSSAQLLGTGTGYTVTAISQ